MPVWPSEQTTYKHFALWVAWMSCFWFSLFIVRWIMKCTNRHMHHCLNWNGNWVQVWLKIPFFETACKCILLLVYCRCVQLTRAESSLPQGLSYAVVQWQKGTSCSHFITCLLLIITLETTWKLQEVILLLTSYSLLVKYSLHNSLEQRQT